LVDHADGTTCVATVAWINATIVLWAAVKYTATPMRIGLKAHGP
jgi:hypothetical protein